MTLVGPRSFAILWLGVILVATLAPSEPSDEVLPILCVLCGYGGVADAVLNLGLFLPLGVALTIDGWRPVRVVALGALLSLGVESAQFFLPGRDTSLSDLLFNTLGTALGVMVACSTTLWWRPQPRLAGVVATIGPLGVGLTLGMTAVLVGPAFPQDTYYGGWTQRLGHLEWYGGRVLQAELGGLEVPPGVLGNSTEVRRRLLSHATIYVRASAGPRPARLAPLFSVHDGHQREILLLGVDGDDVVYRYRTRAIAVGLLGPEIRVRDALRGVAWRNPLNVVVRRVGASYCIRVNASEHCGLGFTAGDAWAFLLGGQRELVWLQSVLNPGWLAIVFFPIGRWTRGAWSVVAIILSLSVLWVVPPTIGLMPTPMTEFAGALAGLLVGWASWRTDGSC